MAKSGTDSFLRIGKKCNRTESCSEQVENNLELLRKRVDELEKKVEKIEERSKPGLRRI
jgi:prefoldin subunit 5